MRTTDELAEKARFMRNAAPHFYDEFVNAFSKYTSGQVGYLLETTDGFQRAQGSAQQCAKLLKLLEGVKDG